MISPSVNLPSCQLTGIPNPAEAHMNGLSNGWIPFWFLISLPFTAGYSGLYHFALTLLTAKPQCRTESTVGPFDLLERTPTTRKIDCRVNGHFFTPVSWWEAFLVFAEYRTQLASSSGLIVSVQWQ